MIKAIIFDAGNVLVVSDYASYFMAKILEVEEKELWDKMKPLINDYVVGKISQKSFWGHIHKELKIKSKKNNYNKELIELFKKEGVINLENVKIAKILKKKGYRLAVLSNTIPDFAIVRKKLEFMKVFDHKVFSAEVKMAKPQRKIYLYVSRKLKVKPSECLFIDDYKPFILAAKKVGMKTILYKNSQQLWLELKRIGVL